MVILKILLYLVLIVAVLVFLIIGGFLGFLKIQHPTLTFDELIDEFKVKVLTLLGVHESIEDHQDQPLPAHEETPAPAIEREIVEAEEVIPPPSAETPSPSATKPETSSTAKPSSENPKEPPLAKQDGPVPDWLKGL